MNRPAGFSLVEMVIALAVISVTFIGIIGLLGLGLISDQTSSDQTVATNIATSVIADLRSTSSSATKSTIFNLTMPTTTASSPPLGSVTPTSLYFDGSANYIGNSPAGAVYVARVYLARIVLIGPTATASLPQSSDMVRVVVSWAAATTTTPAGSVDIITQFNVHSRPPPIGHENESIFFPGDRQDIGTLGFKRQPLLIVCPPAGIALGHPVPENAVGSREARIARLPVRGS